MKRPDQEEEITGQDTTKEDLTLAGNGATVQGQSLRGNGPTVQGQGFFGDIGKGLGNIIGAVSKGTGDIVGAVGDATSNIVGAAAPDTINLTPTMNNQVSVLGLKRNPNLRPGATNQKGNLEEVTSAAAADGATVEGQGFFQNVFNHGSNGASNIRNNIRNKAQNALNRVRQVTGLKQEAQDGQSVQGQSLRGNGPTVQGQGFFGDIRRGINKAAGAIADGTTKAVRAVGDATANVVEAAAPETVNITPTMNNQASVIGAGK